jgi:hypothetical protein
LTARTTRYIFTLEYLGRPRARGQRPPPAVLDADDVKKIFEIDPGTDGLYNTADDIRTSFSTKDFGSTDPEDVTYHPGEGVLYFSDGLNAEVYRLAPGANGVFDGVPRAGATCSG